MLKGLVVYDSVTGSTEKMAMAIGHGMQRTGLDVGIKYVKDALLSELVSADAVVLGSPTYFANMTNRMKRFIDESVKIYRDNLGLKDKIGAAFTSSKGLGSEMTLLSLILAMFVHGMVIVGHQSGELGAVSLGRPDEKCIAECEAFGERIGNLAKVLRPRVHRVKENRNTVKSATGI